MNKKLFIFEMANNHMGSVEHGKRIIEEFSRVKEEFPQFSFGMKFQFRHMDTFIHPDYQHRMDIKYVKRFKETDLTEKEFWDLKLYAEEKGFIPICTGFDEPSISRIEEMQFPIIKIASCSFTDWPLLNRIAETDIPIIASTATATLPQIDNVVSFFTNRNKDLTLMHCVAEYPTGADKLQMNQIKILKERYPEIKVGFSTHEDPAITGTLPVAIAMGAEVFEKHVGVETEEYALNAYSATPEVVRDWLHSAQEGLAMCGETEDRLYFTSKEISDIRTFKRGVFANRDIAAGEKVTREDVFYAFPCQDGQVLANEMSKYTSYITEVDLPKLASVQHTKVKTLDLRKDIFDIRNAVRDLVVKSRVVVPKDAPLEISHHYGVDTFYRTGLAMITVVNEGYCKKLLVSLPEQTHPTQYHEKKTETFVVLYGRVHLYLDGEYQLLTVGDVATIQPGVHHRFVAGDEGSVLEEISTTHFVDDSYYVDDSITNNKNRKTFVSYWME